MPFLVYEKLCEYSDTDGRKLAEILAPICIIVLLIFIFTGASNLINLGENFSTSSIVSASPSAESKVNNYKTVDVPGLQAKYGIYGTCSDAARIAVEISNIDSIYKCSSRKQLAEQNCYYKGHYIDFQVIYELGSLAEAICDKEFAKIKPTTTIDKYQYCRDSYSGTTYNPSTNTCEYTPTTQSNGFRSTSITSSIEGQYAETLRNKVCLNFFSDGSVFAHSKGSNSGVTGTYQVFGNQMRLFLSTTFFDQTYEGSVLCDLKGDTIDCGTEGLYKPSSSC